VKNIDRLKTVFAVGCALVLLTGCAGTGEKKEGRDIGVSVACPVSGEHINNLAEAQMVEYRGEKYYFCCIRCKEDFEKNPERYLAR
jgi:YHS domain-containing protein